MKLDFNRLRTAFLKPKKTAPANRNDLMTKAYVAAQSAPDTLALGARLAAGHDCGVATHAALQKPVAPKLDLTLPPRTHGEYVMRFEYLSAPQRLWCKVNLPAGKVSKATPEQIREYLGAPYPAKNSHVSTR